MLELYPLGAFASQGERAKVAFGDTEFSCTDYMLARKLSEAGVQDVYNYRRVPSSSTSPPHAHVGVADLPDPRERRWDTADPVQLAAFPWKGVMHTSDLFFLFSGARVRPSPSRAWTSG